MGGGRQEQKLVIISQGVLLSTPLQLFELLSHTKPFQRKVKALDPNISHPPEIILPRFSNSSALAERNVLQILLWCRLVAHAFS